MTDWLKEIEITNEMLDEDYRFIAERIGMDNLFKLLRMFDKSAVYFSMERLDKPRRVYIKKNASKGVKELSRVLGVSERYIYKILHEENYVPENQLELNI